MKQNKYDEERFFTAYGQMTRSLQGLEGAGEWHVWRKLMPDLRNKNVLDLGCGYGWHCRYAREQQARYVMGIDISARMLERARELTDDASITYFCTAIEDVQLEASAFDVVISSLALHYVASFQAVCRKVYDGLVPGGTFLFSVEHPIFTCRSEQDWWRDEDGSLLHWPVDHYQSEGLRQTIFLGDRVIKYHRTLASYVNDLIKSGFRLLSVQEPPPSEDMLNSMPGMKDELRRPMFLMILAQKE